MSKPKEEAIQTKYTLCKGIEDLYPYELELPTPPPAHEIINYGLPKSEQVFRRVVIPKEVQRLNMLPREQAIAAAEANPEIAEFIERMWYKFTYGEWQYINGKALHISPTYWFYLNFWKLDAGLPKFRYDLTHFTTDLWEFAWWDYIVQPSDVCFGEIQATLRRAGKTYKALCKAYKRIISKRNAMGCIQSKTDDDAADAFTVKMVTPVLNLPFFFKPYQANSLMPKKEGFRFMPKSGKSDKDVSLNPDDYLFSSIEYRASGETAADGPKWYVHVTDEDGKCFGRGTKVRMIDGSIKAVEDIVVNDLVMGDDSTIRNVLNTTHGKSELYKIVPNKGEPFVCNGNHTLHLLASDNFAIDGIKYLVGDVINISVNDYLKLKPYQKKSVVIYRNGWEYLSSDFDIDPYFLGLWLGDGSHSDISITNVDIEVIEYLKKHAKNNGLSLTEISGKTYKISCTRKSKTKKIRPDGIVVDEYASIQLAMQENCIRDRQGFGKHKNTDKLYRGFYWETEKVNNKILSAFQNNNLILNKHIPNNYIVNSREVRLELLAGIIDSDGYAIPNPKNKAFTKGFQIVQKREHLAKQIHELASSLGFYCSFREKQATMRRADGSVYKCNVFSLEIYGDIDIIPTKVKRKQAKVSRTKNRKSPNKTGFKVEPIGFGEYFGFEVDGNNLFLLADGTVVHNCKEVDVWERHRVVLPALTQDEMIYGKELTTTTVEEMEKGGGLRFWYKWVMSDRNPNKEKKDLTVDERGKTASGLWQWFCPARCAVVWDKYGCAIIEEPTTEQQEWLKNVRKDPQYKIGGRERIRRKIDALKSQQDRHSEMRKFPEEVRDMFLSASGRCYFDLGILNERLKYFAMGYPKEMATQMTFGNFHWKGGVFGGEVEFIPTDRDSAKNWISYLPRMEHRNKWKIDDYTGKKIPGNWHKFCAGADAFKFDTEDVINKKDMSLGAMHIYAEYDINVDVPGANPETYVTDDICLEYLWREDTMTVDDLCEDYLKACIFYGCKLFPEKNNPEVVSYFKRHGFENYLQFDMQYKSQDGAVFLQEKGGAGANTDSKSVQSMFKVVQRYVKEKGLRCKFYRTLEQLKHVSPDPKGMNPYDLFVSLATCLRVVQEFNPITLKEDEQAELDVSDIKGIFSSSVPNYRSDDEEGGYGTDAGTAW